MRFEERLLYRFGPFELDASAKVLFCDGQPVPLAPKTVETLLVLLENPSRILTKEELFHAIWPDRFVDAVNLSQHMSLLRKALACKSEGVEYIRTFPSRGYQFVVPVERVAPSISNVPEPPPAVLEHQHPRRYLPKNKLLVGSVAVFAGIVLLSALYFATRRRPVSAPQRVPASRLAGAKFQPALSADGSKIAFVWDQGDKNSPCLYVKFEHEETPRMVPGSCGNPGSPAWSPDSNSIAYLRRGTLSTEVVIGDTESPGRVFARIAPTRYLMTQRLLDWSADGRWLAVSDKRELEQPLAIYLISFPTGEKRQLTEPQHLPVGDVAPRFSPDMRTVVFLRVLSRYADQICTIPVTGGASRCALQVSQRISDVAWTPDGAEILFGSNRGGDFRLWRAPVRGNLSEASTDPSGIFADNPIQFSVSGRAARLVYTTLGDDLNIWRLTLPGQPDWSPLWTRLIASAGLDAAPQYSPDGTRICFLSDRSGTEQLWVANADGSSPYQLTRKHFDPGPGRWSPDGFSIVFNSHNPEFGGIRIIPAAGGEARQVPTDISGSLAVFSADGNWLYYVKEKSGTFQIFKCPAAGGTAVQVTRDGGHRAVPSPDGRFLYYVKARNSRWIWRIGVVGGKEAPVVEGLIPGYFGCWTLFDDRIIFLGEDPKTQVPAIFRFDLRNSQTVLLTEVPGPLPSLGTSELSISPDGKNLLIVQRHLTSSDLLAINGFR